MFEYIHIHIYSLLEVKCLDIKLNLGQFLREWQTYENGQTSYWPRFYKRLPQFLARLARFSAGQLARRLTRRPDTFLTIVSPQQSVRDSNSFTPVLVNIPPVSLPLKLYFQEKKKKKNQPKNSSGPKHSLGHRMLRGTGKIWLKHFSESVVGMAVSPFRLCAYFHNCLILSCGQALKNRNKKLSEHCKHFQWVEGSVWLESLQMKGN